MSIIHDALKKAAREIEQTPDVAVKKPEQVKKPVNSQNLRYGLIVILIALATFMAYKLVVSQPKTKPAPASPAIHAQSPRLMGTMVMNGHETAIFNNKSYQVGDEIDGSIIIKIQPERVVLSHHGEKQELRL